MANEKVQKVNELLLAGEPENISVDEHSGYTGYKPQAVVDAMNDMFWGEWGFTEISSEVVAGDKSGLAVAQVKVWIKGVEFQPTGWGQNRVTRGDIGDARKGAQTDAIKKALSYFSIGNRAYHGLLPNKKEQAMAERQANNQQQASVQSARASQFATRQSQPAKPAQTTLIAEQKPEQAQGDTQPKVDAPSIERIKNSANRVYEGDGGYASLKALFVAKYELGDIPDEDIPANIRIEMADTLRTEAANRQPQKKAS